MVLLFAGAGVVQVLGLPPILNAYARWGYEDWFRIGIGLVEIEAALLLAFDSTKYWGVSQLAPIMLSSIYTHAKTRGEFPLSIIPALTELSLAHNDGNANKLRDQNISPSAPSVVAALTSREPLL